MADAQQLIQRKALLERKRELLIKKQQLSEVKAEPVQGVRPNNSLTPPSIMSAVLPFGSELETVFRRSDLLPAIGQLGGGRFGGYRGAVAGAAIGEAGKQAVETLKGERKPSLGEFAGNVGLTALLEGLTRGTGKLFFRKQIANDTLEQLSKKLAGMKEGMMANPSNQAISDPIRKTIEEAYSMLPEPVKRGGTDDVLKRWMSYLKENPVLNANDLIAMETDLGNAASYGQVVKGVFQPAEVPNPATNQVAKLGRTSVSDTVDRMSESSGQVGFKETSKKISKLLERYPDFDPTKAYGSFAGRMGTAIGATALTGHPLVGVGAYAAEKFLQNPTVRNILFKAAKTAPARTVGTGTKVGITELLKNLLGGR